MAIVIIFIIIARRVFVKPKARHGTAPSIPHRSQGTRAGDGSFAVCVSVSVSQCNVMQCNAMQCNAMQCNAQPKYIAEENTSDAADDDDNNNRVIISILISFSPQQR